jgi:hypothetical protein
LWWELIESGFEPTKKERASLYNDYLLVEVNRLASATPDERERGYQRLAHRVWPALGLYPECGNGVANNLLALASLAPLELPLAEIGRDFGHCPGIEERFDALPPDTARHLRNAN